MTKPFTTVGIVGAGAMGRDIARIAAQAGCKVLLLDSQPGAADAASHLIRQQWQDLSDKGRIAPAASLQELASCDLVIEAIVERLDAKQTLLQQIETIVTASTILASNTSSLSITAVGAALQRPDRFAGFHFSPPAPQRKVVEIIPGLQTAPAVCARLADFARALGHVPVAARDVPGFIVQRTGLGFVTEALRIVDEGVADYATVDRILRDQAGFGMGPFELMDLVGLDVAHPLAESLYRQHYEEPRFRPGTAAARLLAGGLTGRQSGEGFYRYVDGVAQAPSEPAVPQVAEVPPVWVSPRAARRAELYQLLKDLGARIETGTSPSAAALTLVAPLGFDVTTVAVVERLDPARTIGIDLLADDASTRRRVLATNPATRRDMRDAAHALFARDGKAVSVVRDSGGFVTQRVAATLVNIACDICQQRIGTPKDLETAATLGLGYPLGPLALGDRWGPTNILEVLFNLQTVYGDPRYRPSPWLRRRGAIGLSLMHEED